MLMLTFKDAHHARPRAPTTQRNHSRVTKQLARNNPDGNKRTKDKRLRNRNQQDGRRGNNPERKHKRRHKGRQHNKHNHTSTATRPASTTLNNGTVLSQAPQEATQFFICCVGQLL